MLLNDDKQKITKVLENMPEKLVLSNPVDRAYPYRKTVLSKILLKGVECYQVERFTDKQVFHENIEKERLKDVALSEFPVNYSQLNIFGTDKQWDFRMTKKDRLLFNVHTRKEKRRIAVGNMTRQITMSGGQLSTHNRKKNYLLEEGTLIPPLVDLGIFTKEGKVVHSKYNKYKQINRFLELVDDVIKDYDKSCWHIIDFGCGKSYLTFILYYYLVKVRGMTVYMTGLDLKADVVENCNATAKKYGYDSLHFEIGDINGYQAAGTVDMVITLHACDTATDYALYNAIQWDADIILSVPCCQHELNAQMKPEHLTAIGKYGIIKERVAALLTDTVRGCLLEYSGYRTQLLEFIDMAHSPKNILIRAVRTGMPEKKREQALDEVYTICEEFQVEPMLLKLLTTKKSGQPYGLSKW